MLGYMQDKRHKLIAYLQAESGLAIGTVRSLKNKHLREIKTKKRPVFIELDPEKYTGKHPEGLAFLSPTAEKLYKQLCQEGKIDENDPEAYIISKPKSHEPLAYTTIRGVFKRATQDAQLDPKIQPTHCLVKYFNNALDKAGLTEQRQKIHNGHGNGVQDHYTTMNIDLARKEYADAYPFIDIDNPTDPSLVKEIGSQSQEIQQLKELIENQDKKLANQDKRFDTLTALLKKSTDVDFSKPSSEQLSKALERPHLVRELILERSTAKINEIYQRQAERFEALPKTIQTRKDDIGFAANIEETEELLEQLESGQTEKAEQLLRELEKRATEEAKQNIKRLEKWYAEETSQESREKWTQRIQEQKQRLQRLNQTT
jgi:hypothetical protein